MERARLDEEQRKIDELIAEEAMEMAETDREKAMIRVDEMKRNQVLEIFPRDGSGRDQCQHVVEASVSMWYISSRCTYTQ